ncbi:Lactation elevated protein 1 [Babesia microti strain RI]|uniref:Lactation elevated protein 1 n=1 Tax=Babesia microti (strain RI) TaxID=1133968 RepID=A0A1N6LY61_BABMR|nr:LOW QUALITY PROTEIN: Lactation elevated protein 1 [Babesia microti strain RI]SIO73820.1 Lactation elevated protein 1 [Babesia microti strain RI]|eukprot:XP_021337877.1 LOW QUALITY PROTEIN: Lactation elevated protein 1 [Babesia microti strain RI]
MSRIKAIGLLLTSCGIKFRIPNISHARFYTFCAHKSKALQFIVFHYRFNMRYYSTCEIVLSETQKKLVEKLQGIEYRMAQSATDFVSGIYIHGGVGQGKTMLMDQFYNRSTQPKMRMHFHNFMTEIQKKLHKLRISGVSDALDGICREIRQNARLICLDEFQVEHISDAMILKALFDRLFNLGCTLVSTSNKKPEELYLVISYLGGLNRERFLPFIDTLMEHCLVYNLDANIDYRQCNGGIVHFYWPHRGFEYIKLLITKMGKQPGATDVSLQISPLKTLNIPFVIDSNDGTGKNLAAFTFNSLFSVPSGTNEYIAICDNYCVVGISNIPQFDIATTQSDELTRFIKFIDIAYESNTKIIFDSSKPLYQMFGQLKNNKLFEKVGLSLIDLGVDPSDCITQESFFDLLANKLDPNSINSAIDIVNSVRGDVTFSDSLWALVYDNAIYYSEDVKFVENISNFDYLSHNFSSPISFKFDDGLKNYPRTLSRIRHMSSGNYWK